MKRLFFKLFRVLSVVIFAVAVYILYRQLAHHDLHEILHSIARIPPWQVAAAIAISLLNYALVAGYDMLAFRYIERSISWREIFFVGFVTDAISNNTGYAFVSASASRYRLYTNLGVKPADIGKVILFSTITLWIGLVSDVALMFIFKPRLVPRALHLDAGSTQLLGAMILLAVAAYIYLCATRRTAFHWRKWHFSLPSGKIAAGQVAVSSLDWMLGALALYILLPKISISFFGFLGIYIFAQYAGIISQVPGGIGVFESIIVIIFPRRFSAAEIFGPLLVFRFIYYFLPLALALAALGLRKAASIKSRL